jgi:hypothetical protein
MANFKARDFRDEEIYLSATGAGTNADPLVLTVGASFAGGTAALGTVRVTAGTVSIGGTVPVTVSSGTVTLNRNPWTSVTGQFTATGLGTVVAAPGSGTVLWLLEEFIQNPTATATTIIFNSGTVPYRTVLCQAQGDGFSQLYAMGSERILGDNCGLILNNSAGTIDYAFRYRVVTV